MSWRNACALLALGQTLGACTGTETGNPSFEGTLSYAAYSSDPGRAALRVAPGPGLVVDQAWLKLGDVRLVPSMEGCDLRRDGELASTGIGIGDHATGHPVQRALSLVPGRYCALRIGLERAQDDVGPAPAELRSASVLITGVRADGVGFELRSTSLEQLVLRSAAGGFELDRDHPAILLGFDVATWLDGIGLQDVPAADGGVLIDAEHAPDVLHAFERKIAAGTLLFRDRDGDGMADDATPIASGAP